LIIRRELSSAGGSAIDGRVEVAINNGANGAIGWPAESPTEASFPHSYRVPPNRMNFFQKPFDSLKTQSYIRATDGDDALGGRKAIRFSRVYQAHASRPKGWGEDGSVFLEAQAFGRVFCCLTIESEERETWTAEVLADRPLTRAVEETL